MEWSLEMIKQLRTHFGNVFLSFKLESFNANEPFALRKAECPMQSKLEGGRTLVEPKRRDRKMNGKRAGNEKMDKSAEMRLLPV